MTNAILTTAEQARQFVQAGNATLTLVSKATGTRFTYRVKAPSKDTSDGGRVLDVNSDMRFVSLLTGSDNENNYSYFGYIRRGIFFHGGTKAKVGRDVPSAKGFDQVWRAIMAHDQIPAWVEIWHEGRCGRCARKLTVPASIASGFGPECAGKIGIPTAFFAEAV